MSSSLGKRLIGEFIGTFLLVFLAVGAAVFGIGAALGIDKNGPGNGVVGVAFAFGLVLLVVAYAIGPVSGAHVNPAVTLAMVVGRKFPMKDAVGYWIVQFLGAIAGAALLKLFVSSFGVTDQTGGLGTNSYDNGAINMAGAFVLEVVLTAAFVAVIMLVTERVAAPGFEAPGVVVSYTTDPDIQNSKKFLAQGLQTAAGVPLQCDEPADFCTFRIGLFGLEKWHNVPRTLQHLRSALDSVAPKQKLAA